MFKQNSKNFDLKFFDSNSSSSSDSYNDFSGNSSDDSSSNNQTIRIHSSSSSYSDTDSSNSFSSDADNDKPIAKNRELSHILLTGDEKTISETFNNISEKTLLKIVFPNKNYMTESGKKFVRDMSHLFNPYQNANINNAEEKLNENNEEQDTGLMCKIYKSCCPW